MPSYRTGEAGSLPVVAIWDVEVGYESPNLSTPDFSDLTRRSMHAYNPARGGEGEGSRTCSFTLWHTVPLERGVVGRGFDIHLVGF